MELIDFSHPEKIRLAKFPDINLAQKSSRKVWEAYKEKLEENGNEKPWLGDLIKMLILFSYKLSSGSKQDIISVCNRAFNPNWEKFKPEFDQKKDWFNFLSLGTTLVSNYPIKIENKSYEDALSEILENFVTRETKPAQQPYGISSAIIIGAPKAEKEIKQDSIEYYFYWYIHSYIPHLLMKSIASKILVITGKKAKIDIPELSANPLLQLSPNYKAYAEALIRRFRAAYNLPELPQNPEFTLSDEAFEQLRYFYDTNCDKDVYLANNSICLEGSVPRDGQTAINRNIYEQLYKEYIKDRYESTSMNTEQEYITSLLVDYILTDFFASHKYFDLSDNSKKSSFSTVTHDYYITKFAVSRRQLKKYFKKIYGQDFIDNPELYYSVWPGVRDKLEQFCFVWQIPFHFYQSNRDGESIVMGSNSFDLETKVPGIQYYASADNFKMIYDLLQKRHLLVEASFCGENYFGPIDPLGPIRNAIKELGFIDLLHSDLTTIDQTVLDAFKKLQVSLTICIPHYDEYADAARLKYISAFIENIPGAVIIESQCVTSGGYGPLHRDTPITQKTVLTICCVNLLRLIQLYKEEEARLQAVTINRKQNKEDEKVLGIKHK